MNNTQIIDKIKLRGYWEVRFTPLEFNPTLIPSKQKLIELVEKNQVRLRGWYYPHVGHWANPSQRKPVIGSKWIEGGSDYDMQIEFWRFSQSGQFLHIFAMDEDYMQESEWFSNREDLKKKKPGEVLNTGSVIYTTSEIFTFLEALAREGIYEEGVKIEISLKGTENRVLDIFDRNKVPLFMEYKSFSQVIKFEKTMTKDEILTDYKKIAVDAMIEIFEIFNWTNSPRHVFEEDQKRLFERRL